MWAIIGPWLIKFLPSILGLFGQLIISLLENLVRDQQNKSAESGAKLLNKLVPVAMSAVKEVDGLGLTDDNEKRAEAKRRIEYDTQEFNLSDSQINTLIELAVQRLKAEK